MTPAQLSALLVELLTVPQETEWVEWKHNNDRSGHDCRTTLRFGKFGGTPRAGVRLHGLGHGRRHQESRRHHVPTSASEEGE